MQPIEETKFIVIETDKATKEPMPAKLVVGLEPYRKRYASVSPLRTFHKTVTSELGQDLFGLQVREATDEDIAAHGGKVEIMDLADLYSGADARVKQDKLKAARGIVEFLEESVKTTDELKDFLYTYSLNTAQVMAMAKLVREELTLGSEFVTAYCKLVSDRSQSTASKRTVAAVKKDWEALPKAEQKKKAAASA